MSESCRHCIVDNTEQTQVFTSLQDYCQTKNIYNFQKNYEAVATNNNINVKTFSKRKN